MKKDYQIFFRIIGGAVLLFFILTILPTSEGGRKGKEAAFDKYKSSVVLVKTTSIYKITFANGEEYFFKDFDDKGILGGFRALKAANEVTTEDYSVSFGTGFFTSKNGIIVTNRHVIQELTEEEKENIISRVRTEISEMENLADTWQRAMDRQGADYYRDENGEITTYSQVAKVRSILNRLSGISQSAKISTEGTCSVALNNTHVETHSDFIDCVRLDYAKDRDIDLALLQIKSKKLPEAVKHVFEIPTDKDMRRISYEEGEKILIIAFNRGLTIGNTEGGLKVQRLEGKITQNTNNNHIQYEASTMPGSSGSPILSEKGKLIGVNFAGFSGEQIKYGVKIGRLKALWGDEYFDVKGGGR